MTRTALLISAFSLTVTAVVPAHAQAPTPTKTAKIKKVKLKRGIKPTAQQTAAQPGGSAASGATAGTSGTEAASGAAGAIGRAVPVAAAHANFFATPLGLVTAVGAAGGATAGAVALSAKGSTSSPS